MVGFGSAFRISRRRGWETAYCDYETLKLLLTQIEAVYEEENTEASVGDGFYAGLSGFGSDDVFYDPHDQHDEQLVALSESRRRQRKQTRRNERGEQKNDWRDELFAESDSSVAFASSECESGVDDEERFSDRSHSSVGQYPSLDDAKFNYSIDNNSGYPSYGSSGSFGIGGTSAARSIVSFESGGSMEHSRGQALQNETNPMLPNKQSAGGHSSREFRGFRSGIGSSKKVGQEIKKPKAKQRRKNKLPPHLRRAHVKARAITGRFLGLLRAEADKVALFTHSRMGELTDTIGSLRFPCDDMEIGNRDEYQLSDGGIHPSSDSSSSEDVSISSSGAGDRDNNNINVPRFQGRQGRNSERTNRKQIMEATLMNANMQDVDRTTFRQLNAAELLRLARPIFRSDQVLGDDSLLLSAVDEADAFTAVGVEFLHLLRYVCVNAIVIRKLCKKHDHLLTRRMLGGYYHKLKNRSDRINDTSENSRLDSTPRRGNVRQTFGKRQAQSSTTSSKSLRHQARYGMHILLGTYDSKVQDLANSVIADTLSQSLELALSEFEISRRRADRLASKPVRKSRVELSENLTNLASDNLCYGFPSPKTFGFASKTMEDNFRDRSGDDDDTSEDVSSSSSISLTRFHFVVSSAKILRDEAIQRRSVFGEYLSLSCLVLDKNHFIGEPRGLNGGCSRETLEFFSSYNPDLALILDSHILQQALSTEDHFQPLSRILGDNESADNVSTPKRLRVNSVHSSCASLLSTGRPSPRNQGQPLDLKRREYMFRLNIFAVILSTMNYYIILPSAAEFCCSLGWNHVHSALLIGITNVTILMSLVYHSYHINQPHTMGRGCSLKVLMVISCLCPIIGNIFYSKAYEHHSLFIAMIGRLLIGFSSTELLNKHIILVFQVKGNATTEVARIKIAQIGSIVIALVLGSFDIKERKIGFYGQSFLLNFKTMPGYVMALAWVCLLMAYLCFKFPVEEVQFIALHEKRGELSISTSEHEDRHYRIDKDYLLPGILSRVSGECILDEDDQSTIIYKPTLSVRVGSLMVSLKRSKKLFMHNVALPVTLLLYGSVHLITEMLLTSSVIIMNRYFKCSFAHTGKALAVLVALMIPIHLSMSYLSTILGERVLIKKSLITMAIGILFFINYEALFFLCKDIHDLFRRESTDSPLTTYYDWDFGLTQYGFSATLMFLSSVALEGLSSTLMSKVSPAKLNKSPINCSVIGPVFGCLCRFLGNTIIVFVGFSHRVINTDMVNSLAFILVGICFCCVHIVRKHYFFLNGS